MVFLNQQYSEIQQIPAPIAFALYSRAQHWINKILGNVNKILKPFSKKKKEDEKPKIRSPPIPKHLIPPGGP